MATWAQVTLLLHTMYDVLTDTPDSVQIQVPTGEGRSQLVTVRHVEDGAGWVVLDSPVARLADVDVVRALTLAEDLPCGGLTKRLEFLTVTHAAPLETLDVQDLARPLEVVVRAADRLERHLVGVDYL